MSEESIATKLRQAREQQGKTHEQIHRQLGLSLNVLQSVESGNFKVVEPIYIRMILKTYADHLGLDGSAILKQYNDQFGTPPPTLEVPPSPTPGPHPQVALGDDLDLPTAPGITPPWQPSPLPTGAFSEPKRPSSRGGLLILGGGALLLVLLLTLYLSDNTGDEPRTAGRPERTAPQARPQAGPRPELAPQPPAQAPPEPSAQPQAATAMTPEAAPDTALPPMPAAMTDPQVPSLATPEAPAPKPTAEIPAPTPTTTPAPAPAGALVLEVEVTAPTWVRIRWDKGGFLETMLQPGDNRRLQASTQFLVWAGNSKGLRYRFQGQPIAEISQSDPSRTVRFKATKAGVSLLDRETFDQLSEVAREQDTIAKARPDSAR